MYLLSYPRSTLMHEDAKVVWEVVTHRDHTTPLAPQGHRRFFIFGFLKCFEIGHLRES